jgi:predicted TIM-barrel fold metal-dependent hydrolase
VNEYLAGVIADHPGRFGAFAVLPLPDVDGSLVELAYALDVLGLDGIGLMSNYRGVYLGDRELDELFAELNHRASVCFLHPNVPSATDQPTFGLPPSLYEFTFDTTRSVANMLYQGTLERYSDIRLIVAHAGGALPFLARRLEFGPTIDPRLGDRAPADLLGVLRSCYFDVAMSANPFSLAALSAFAATGQILLGTDYPFMPAEHGADNIAGLSAYEGFSPTDLSAILSENARRLLALPRTGDAGSAG